MRLSLPHSLYLGALLFLLTGTNSPAAATPCMSSDTSPEACQSVLQNDGAAPTSNISFGTRLNAGVTNVLFNSFTGGCRFFDNNSGNDYFIPQGSPAEFGAVIKRPPVSVNLANCVFPVPGASSAFTAPSTVPYTTYQIFSEGGALVPESLNSPTTISSIAVPTIQGIVRVGSTTTVSAVDSTSNAPIEFHYTRQDCRVDNAGSTACNTRSIKEVQSMIYTGVPSNPAGSDGHWSLTDVVSTFYGQNPTTLLWTKINGPSADYQPPGLQSCTMNGTTYNNGSLWTTAATSSQTPTVAECPAGAGSRMDTMSSTTHYLCNDGLAGAQSTDPVVETGFTGSCAPAPVAQTIYVVDTSNSRVQAFDLSGKYLSTFGTTGSANGQFNVPWAIHTDLSKNLLVTDSNNSRVEKFDENGSFMGSIGSPGTGLGQFGLTDVANQAPDGRIWVSDFTNNDITVFSATGTPLFQKGGFSAPSGIAFDNDGNTWVANTGTSQMMQLDSNGNVVFAFGSPGSGPGQFNFAWSMMFDSQNRMWVADRNNNRIQVFNTSGTLLLKFGSAGSGNGQFNYPIDLAFDASGNVWITELNGNRVQEFDSAGNYLFKFGSTGSGPGQFNGSIGICIR